VVRIKHWLWRGAVLALVMTILGGIGVTAQAATVTKVPARAAFVMDATSGQVLYQQNADKKYPIASLSKLLTVYLTVKAINDGQIGWNDPVPMSKDLINSATTTPIPHYG